VALRPRLATGLPFGDFLFEKQLSNSAEGSSKGNANGLKRDNDGANLPENKGE
jgi:hypothetical protein